MFRFRSSFIAAAMFTVGAIVSPGTPRVAAQASADPITITGTGQKQSAPFALAGGTYRVDWSLSNPTARLAWITLESTTEGSVPQSEFVHTMEKDPSGQTFLYKLKPGTYYLRAFAPAAWSVTFTPDPPIETVKPVAAAPKPLALADFAGTWGKHGYSLTISPDGSGEATWRTYRWCEDPGVRPPCDSVRGNEIVYGGHALMSFSRVEGDSAHGTLTETTAPTAMLMPPYPVVLERQSNGTVLLLAGRETTIPAAERRALDGITLCGTLEAWQTGVCGA